MIFYCEKLDEILLFAGQVDVGQGTMRHWQTSLVGLDIDSYIDDNDWVFVGYL